MQRTLAAQARHAREALALGQIEAVDNAPELQWRLSRRFPAEYVERVQVEGTGEGGAIPIDVRADAVGDALAQWLTAKQPHEPGADDDPTQQGPS